MSDPYAIAIVVGREPPVSSHLGDRAVIHKDGRMEGFIGGSCSRDIIRHQALEAIRAGEPRLVRINPGDAIIRNERDIVTIPMRCTSEGALDVYIEPHLAQRKLILVGLTPVAQSLAEIAPVLGFSLVRFVDGDELCDVDGTTIDALADYVASLDDDIRQRSAAVVASQGHYDDVALAAILRHDFGYVGLLASPVRGAAVLREVEASGIAQDRVQSVRYPAGIAIGARKPADVSISILAQIIAVGAERAHMALPSSAEIAADPVS